MTTSKNEHMTDDIRHVVSFSGGKDSAAMLIEMVDRGYHIDEIVFADTQLEFPEMYEYIDSVEDHIGMEITRLKHDKTFEDYFYGAITRGKRKGQMRGWPPLLFGCYINRDVKVQSMNRYVEEQSDHTVNYLGFASDELERTRALQFDTSDRHSYKFPLVEWGWTEEYCVEYLTSIGMEHPLGGRRSGCWLCPKQPLDSLRYVYSAHPDLWSKLLRYEEDAPGPFHPNRDLFELSKRFKDENNQKEKDIK